MTSSKTAKALVVELIRRLWDRGLYRDNAWLRWIHDNWIGAWIDWKTAETIAEVDQQAAQILQGWEEEAAAAQAPVFTETQKGETPLGGPMQLSHPTLGKFDDLIKTDSTED